MSKNKKRSFESRKRELATRARRNADRHERGEKTDPIMWKDIATSLEAGIVKGVPAGVDLDEFIWQMLPESRPQIEARNPGRKFGPAEWARKARES